ncbi:Y-family DNA polymerase [Roseateles sp. P5_E7]
MLWVVLLTSIPAISHEKSSSASPASDGVRGLVLWSLQFTPRVAVMEGCAVAMEVESSLRLFKGLEALKERVSAEAPDLGVVGIGWAPTAMAALVMARCGVLDLGRRLLQPVIDELPLAALTAAVAHEETLSCAGITLLGELRRLPRAQVSRRFGTALLAALDQAYGQRAEVFRYETIPEDFSARIELPAREDHAPALLMYARPLLMQMCGWLASRHAGAVGFRFRWIHDSMRAKDAGDGGEVTIRSAEVLRDLEHFVRLLAEHLAKQELLAPVGELQIDAIGVQALTEQSASLLPESMGSGESLYLVLERIAARLGPKSVLQPVLVDDHRMEWMTHWTPLAKQKRHTPASVPEQPEPTFVLEAPLELAVINHRPHYEGPLTLLIGPDRVEGGWWDRLPGTSATRNVVRDYWIAQSDNAGVLSVFNTQDADGRIAWFLHGHFA